MRKGEIMVGPDDPSIYGVRWLLLVAWQIYTWLSASYIWKGATFVHNIIIKVYYGRVFFFTRVLHKETAEVYCTTPEDDLR